jgi:hypothetical protein
MYYSGLPALFPRKTAIFPHSTPRGAVLVRSLVERFHFQISLLLQQIYFFSLVIFCVFDGLFPSKESCEKLSFF